MIKTKCNALFERFQEVEREFQDVCCNVSKIEEHIVELTNSTDQPAREVLSLTHQIEQSLIEVNHLCAEHKKAVDRLHRELGRYTSCSFVRRWTRAFSLNRAVRQWIAVSAAGLSKLKPILNSLEMEAERLLAATGRYRDLLEGVFHEEVTEDKTVAEQEEELESGSVDTSAESA